MIAPGDRLLGKLPAKSDPRALMLARFVEMPKALPARTHFWPRRKSFPIRSFGNTEYGDCTRASQAILAMRMERLETRRTPSISDDEIIRVYKEMTTRLYGADWVNDPWGADTGAYETDALSAWRRPDETFRDTKGRPLTIDAYLRINHADHRALKEALVTAGAHGIKVCLNLPAAYINVLPPADWDVPAGQPLIGEWQPGSWGGHCTAPGTLVLTSDLRWVPVEALQVGDALVGFDEYPVGGHRWHRTSIVESTKIIQLPCYDLRFDDGTTVRASKDHLWLVGGNDSNHWVKTNDLAWGKNRASRVVKPLEVWKTDESRDGGYLAAAFDGEGWLDGEKSRGIHKAGFCQKDNIMLRHVREALDARGITVREGSSTRGFSGSLVTNLIINTSKANLARFLGMIRPYRLLEKFDPERFGTVVSRRDARLVEKTRCGVQDVVALQTSTRTFYAEGLASHNSMSAVDYDEKGIWMPHQWNIPDQRITWAAAAAYLDEAHVVIDSLDSWRKRGDIPKKVAEKIASAVNDVSDTKIAA